MYTTLIDCTDLHAALNRNDCVIVDCRFDLADPAAGRRQYLEGHIPGAVYAHLDDDLSGTKAVGQGRHPLPSPEKLISVFSNWGISSGTQVIAYDAAGGMLAAARLWWLLRYMSHDAVAVLDGGWSAWVAAGLPVTGGAETCRTAVFSGTPRPQRVVLAKDVTSAPRLIDSRDPVRYRGEAEPIDPVAGHIPSAVNYFCKTNLDTDGRFRTPSDLHAALRPVIGGVASENAVFYCGSGVTACHNILAAVHAGFDEPRLYAGSWSEWCADPLRPVATGAQDGTR